MGKDNKTLSIIIPNYNKGRFITNTIESILGQTRLPNEVIIVDDCSTDNSRQIIEVFLCNYPNIIKTINLNKNHGVQYCRNLGAKLATSEYICFVDSDDVYIRNDCIEQQMKFVGKKRLVGVYQLLIDSNNNIISNPVSKKKKRNHRNHPIYYFYIMNDFMTWPFHYIIEKSEFISLGGYDNPFSLYEDADILLKLVLNKNKPIWVNIEGKGYRVDANDNTHISHAPNDRLLSAKEFIWNKYRSVLPLKTRIYAYYLKFCMLIKHFIKK